MKRFAVGAVLAAVSLAVVAGGAVAQPPAASTFVGVLTAAEEVPLCAAATNAARGVATFHVLDEGTGTVAYKLVANNLPGSVTAAHIHVAPSGTPGGIVQGLDVVAGAENGVIGGGSFANPTLLAAIRGNPGNYYVNVHTGPAGVGCPSGVIRGQLDDHGPLNG